MLPVVACCRLAAISSLQVQTPRSSDLIHNNITPPVPPRRHSLTRRRRSDSIPALSPPLKAEFCQDHSDPPCWGLCLIYRAVRRNIHRNKAASDRQCVRGLPTLCHYYCCGYSLFIAATHVCKLQNTMLYIGYIQTIDSEQCEQERE